jgi:hypothetical protein
MPYGPLMSLDGQWGSIMWEKSLLKVMEFPVVALFDVEDATLFVRKGLV